MRRVGISEFKNTNMINIREYYEKDGRRLMRGFLQHDC